MSASSVLEESDLPDVTLTPDEQRAQHRDGYSDAPDGAAAAVMPRAAAVVPSRLTRSEATIGTARQAGSGELIACRPVPRVAPELLPAPPTYSSLRRLFLCICVIPVLLRE